MYAAAASISTQQDNVKALKYHFKNLKHFFLNANGCSEALTA